MTETFCTLPTAPKLALLADLHARPYRQIIRSLRKNRPPLICIAGDLFCGSRPADGRSPLLSQPNVLSFLKECAAVAPTYLSLGNHEQWLDSADLEGLRGSGAVILDNGWLEKDGLVIGGLTSGYCMDVRRYRSARNGPVERYPEPGRDFEYLRRPDVSWLKAFAAGPGYHVLLCHHPEYYPLIPGAIEMILSGHAHGGQIRLFGRGVFAPGQGFRPRYSKGIYHDRLVVSAGLSNPARAPRIFNPTEIVYVGMR